ncbi:MAG TPA: methyl-accepting chemotaxis protein, partial [Kofleriaceae bacterium]|nr:methyl-accepting chemotaxis protein [Kofleriaceae bacterium]
MNWFKNLNLGMKLACAFLAVIGLGAALGGFTLLRLASISDRADVLTKDALPGIAKGSAISDLAAQTRRHALGVLLAETAEETAAERAALRKQIDDDAAQLTRELAAYRAAVTRPDLQALLDEIQARWVTYSHAQDELLALAMDPAHIGEALATRNVSMKLFDDVRDAIARLTRLDAEAGNTAGVEIYRMIDSANLGVSVFVLASILVGLGIAIAVTRRLSRPIRALEAAARAMASGELGHEVAYTAKDELGALAASFRASSGALGSVVGELQRLIHAAQDGRLGVRGDATRFAGAYAELVSGTNALL